MTTKRDRMRPAFTHLPTRRSPSPVGSLPLAPLFTPHSFHLLPKFVAMHKSIVVVFAVCLIAAHVDCREEESPLAPKRFDYAFQKRADEKTVQVTEADVINEVQRNLAKSMAYLDEVQNGAKYNEKRRNKFEFIRFGK
uniref:Uncharacterized protein n=1 Tax=Plectus sambesii TaxID=2011161 RepID=A0A914V724_9BILA